MGTTAPCADAETFAHQALLYSGPDDFVDRAAPQIAAAVAQNQPVLVAIDPVKIAALKQRLGDISRSVQWRDIRQVGRNPARIIPVWREFVAKNESAQSLLGFGEPVWAGRTSEELAEAQLHEQLLNVAFSDTSGFTLVCPYDVETLDHSVLAETLRSHKCIEDTTARRFAGQYDGLAQTSTKEPFAEPNAEAAEISLDPNAVGDLRRFVQNSTRDAGFVPSQADDLTLAIVAIMSALKANGADGRVRIWVEPASAVAEVSGLRSLDDPLAGREWPAPTEGPSVGIWLANQLCSLVQVRGDGDATVVRLHIAR